MAAKPRVMIAMSGGVDSSVAALIVQRLGYECAGVTMKLLAENDGSAAEDAARVAAALGIKHHVVDFSEEFRAGVIEPFILAYENGTTPNPCIECNNVIKFGRLLEYAKEMGFDKLATGHYARIIGEENGVYDLVRAVDTDKDQSYFLYGLSQKTLDRVMFPLGDLTKSKVRSIAEEAGFVNANRAESQDICFVPGGSHADYIESYRGRVSKPGNFVDTEGNIIGRHAGIIRYTIGQRKGLGLALGRPLFVKEIRPEMNEVVLGDEEDIFTSWIEIADFEWVDAFEEHQFGITSAVYGYIMLRYNSKPVWAKVEPGNKGRLIATFKEPVRAPAKGQAAVLYDIYLGRFSRVFGGGRIV